MSISDIKILNSINVITKNMAPLSQDPRAGKLREQLHNLEFALSNYHNAVSGFTETKLPGLIDEIDNKLNLVSKEFEKYDTLPVRWQEGNARAVIGETICMLEKEIDVIKGRQGNREIRRKRKEQMTRALHDRLREGIPMGESPENKMQWLRAIDREAGESDINIPYATENNSMQDGKKNGLWNNENPMEYAIRLREKFSNYETTDLEGIVVGSIKKAIFDEGYFLANELFKVISSHGGMTQKENRNDLGEKFSRNKLRRSIKPDDIEKSKTTSWDKSINH